MSTSRMRLNTLHIRREHSWSDKDKGKLIGTVELDSMEGSISIKIDEQAAQQIIALCAEGLRAEAQKVANLMTSQILEAAAVGSGNLLQHQN